MLQGRDGEPYVTADDCPPAVYDAARKLPLNTVSDVVEIKPGGAARTYGRFLFAVVEERRPAGPMPLEGKLFEQLLDRLNRRKSARLEDEWFHRALKEKLVVDNNGCRMPEEFLFAEVAEPPGEGTER